MTLKDETAANLAMNKDFLEALYQLHQENSDGLAPEWQALFERVLTDAPPQRRASWAQPLPNICDHQPQKSKIKPDPSAPAAPREGYAAALDSVRAIMMIRAYRVRGHLDADLDPLKLETKQPHPELDPASYGFTPEDWDRPIFIDHVLGLETATIRQMLKIVQQTYCGTLGVEFMHISAPAEKAWLQERIEGRDKIGLRLDGEKKRALMRALVAVESFETFLGKKYVATKRFGLDGAEMTVPAIEWIIDASAQMGAKEAVIGMPHRGRLNILAHVLGKPYEAFFTEFQGGGSLNEVEGSGDVKYHLGDSEDRVFSGHQVHLSLAANPSHLESVDPVVLGRARAKQDHHYGDRESVLPILLHGDAAFAGQGIVAECLGLSGLKGHRAGGAIHFIVNNQIGFTTSPRYARSSPYPSDVGKMVEAPIFHVNGDDPEAVLYAAQLAAEFRHKFLKPVIIDMFCYRRFGHNEGDNPEFTQPLMYKAIKKHKSVMRIYADRLVARGEVSQEEIDEKYEAQNLLLETAFQKTKTFKPEDPDWLAGKWQGLKQASGDVRRGQTGVAIARLKEISEALSKIPEGFNIHATVRRLYETRRKMIAEGAGINWSMAEALAFGTLLREGYPVRLVGQDSERGTFSQRHSVLVDQEDESNHTPLNHLHPEQARFEVVNSMLSEEAVLGFEYGYTQSEPNALTLWEAQFGDFANTAQSIIDQFISSGEEKWLRMSGLVMLLPHGYEGQGPEHSSARLERYLQLCGDDNVQVANCTTPANYFHILRRQLHRNFRKPLFLMTPKSLLRHKDCVSEIEDFRPGSSFHRVLEDDAQTGLHTSIKLAHDDAIKRVILCSGKVYYDLLAHREEENINAIYLVRIEQLYPFRTKPPQDCLRAFLTPRSSGVRKSLKIWVLGVLSSRILRPRSLKLAAPMSAPSMLAAPKPQHPPPDLPLCIKKNWPTCLNRQSVLKQTLRLPTWRKNTLQENKPHEP